MGAIKENKCSIDILPICPGESIELVKEQLDCRFFEPRELAPDFESAPWAMRMRYIEYNKMMLCVFYYQGRCRSEKAIKDLIESGKLNKKVTERLMQIQFDYYYENESK